MGGGDGVVGHGRTLALPPARSGVPDRERAAVQASVRRPFTDVHPAVGISSRTRP
ncbi:hypothetical protein Cpa01nite_35370 [Cellulomonas pakistanensis]|uniref:Uncharacterized protein n=1 Tax=Cellulomonas pakistanensis TaxID=992287 RepID=A0A919U541_9CELL|nr:hypothetical protein Cpa01nite_35370 [Cellulomonas pakistanensis]